MKTVTAIALLIAIRQHSGTIGLNNTLKAFDLDTLRQLYKQAAQAGKAEGTNYNKYFDLMSDIAWAMSAKF